MTRDVRTNGLHIRVHPEPTPEELAAIVAAVGQLAQRLASEAQAETPHHTHGRARWAKAGRREALRSVEWERGGGRQTW